MARSYPHALQKSHYYEPPVTRQVFGETIPEGEGDVWRDGPLLVLRRGGRLPDRCVKCNGPAEGTRFRRTVGVGVLNPRSLHVEIGLCSFHWLRAWQPVVGLVLAVVYCLFMIARYPGTGLAALGAVVGALGLIAAPLKFRSRTIVATRIEDDFVWLRGAHTDYLDGIPSVHDSPGR